MEPCSSRPESFKNLVGSFFLDEMLAVSNRKEEKNWHVQSIHKYEHTQGKTRPERLDNAI